MTVISCFALESLRVTLVAFPIINIVFGGQNHTERRRDSASTRPIEQDSLSMTVRAVSKCPMRKQYKNIFGKRH